MMLGINRSLDIAEFARRYAVEGLVQVPNVFDESTAAQIEKILLSMPWRMVCQNDDKRNIMLTHEQLRAMSPDERQALEVGIRKRAAENFGYAYFTYPMIQAGA